MDIIHRETWRARAPKNRTFIDLNGPTTIHWNGGGTKWESVTPTTEARETWMERRMRAVQSFHMAGRGWSDFAYNFAVDPWGLHAWEGRGLDVRPASQGTTVGNNTSHSVYVATGLGDGPVTEGCLDLIDDLGDWIAREGGTENMFVGHRDWKSTTCPGDFLYDSLSDLNTADPIDGTGDTAVEPAIDPLFDVVALFSQAGGYGAVSSEGEVWMSSGAIPRGDMDGVTLNAPIVDAESSVSGEGYYLVAADGGVFAFGDAVFLGSMGDVALLQPIIAIEVQPGGYWLAAADGGIFSFGLRFDGRPVVL